MAPGRHCSWLRCDSHQSAASAGATHIIIILYIYRPRDLGRALSAHGLQPCLPAFVGALVFTRVVCSCWRLANTPALAVSLALRLCYINEFKHGSALSTYYLANPPCVFVFVVCAALLCV